MNHGAFGEPDRAQVAGAGRLLFSNTKTCVSEVAGTAAFLAFPFSGWIKGSRDSAPPVYSTRLRPNTWVTEEPKGENWQ